MSEEKKLEKQAKKEAKLKKKAERTAIKAKLKKEHQGVFAEFKKFILRGNVVDMAVGVAVAGAFTAIVTAITKNVITPLVSFISGGAGGQEMKVILQKQQVSVNAEGVEEIIKPEIAIMFGPIFQAILDFFIIALMLFTVMKIVTVVVKRTQKVMAEIKKIADAEGEQERLAAEAKAKAEAEAKEAADKAAAAEAAAIAADKEAKQEQMYKDICAQNQLLERIAKALESK